MSENNNTLKLIIQDANGKPQVVKVVRKSSNESTTPIKVKHTPVKIIKLPAGERNIQIPVYKTVEVNSALKLERTSLTQKIKTEPVEEKQAEDLKSKISVKPLPEVGEFERIKPSNISIPSASQASQLCFDTKVMSYTTRRRPHSEDPQPQPEYTSKKRRHADKVGKGLRHFSMKVCEKVRNKGFTSYNEVADELVSEFSAGIHGSSDSQNIRRRVYDALNVLMAMNIISKEKKEIRWLGLPTNSMQECATLEKEKQYKLERIQKKTQQLQELIMQHVSFKSLIERNKEAENKGVKPSPSSAIHLPFIVVNTSDKALIDCSISNDKTEYMFNFNKRFQIHDDIDILKRMGLLHGLDKGECSEEDIQRVQSMVPKSLEQYVEMMGRGNSLDVLDSLDVEVEVEEENQEHSGVFKAEPDAEDADEDQDDAELNESTDDSSDVDV